ncbi:MAG: hypothetical protein HFJ52_03980 [Clostridia bacterium]|jgi:hypothetical protein|nr:hypothetical protein [Clostridia bacterium]
MEIDKNYKYYTEHQEELFKKHKNKFVIIKDEKVIGVYKTLEEAIQNAKNIEAGTYIIQECLQKKKVQTFHTRVRFNG